MTSLQISLTQLRGMIGVTVWHQGQQCRVIEILEDGRIETRISSAEIGQGLVTVLQMITAEELNLPLDQVNVYLSDTDLTPDGGPTSLQTERDIAPARMGIEKERFPRRFIARGGCRDHQREIATAIGATRSGRGAAQEGQAGCGS